MTEKETQSWFDDIEPDKLLDFGFDTSLNPSWLKQFLMSPFGHANWKETKAWLELNLQHQICNMEKCIAPSNIAYDSVMAEFKKTPIILV